MTTDTVSTGFPPAEAAVSPAADQDTLKRNMQVIYLLLVSVFVVMLNETIMSVAIPPIMNSLSVTASEAQWLTTAFLLTMAVVIPVTGFLLQRINTRPVFMLAMGLFCAGTFFAIFAPNLWFLVGARVIQASGTAVMMPLLMTTVMTLVPPDQRGKMMGNISIVMSVAPAVGPLLSGLILSVLDWRWLFIVVLPISLGATWLGWRKITNVSEPRYAPLDILSVILSAVAFGGVVYGISNLGVPAGEGGIPAWVPLIIGGVTMVIFIWRQISLQKTNSPLLDLRTLQSKNFTISLTMMVICMAALFGSIILLPIYMQNVLGMDTWQIGLLLMPGALLMGLLGPQVGKLYDRVGPRPLIIPGMITVSVVLWGMTLLGTGTWFGYILAGHLVMSVGFAFLFGPLFTASLSSIQPQHYSHGSALLGSIQQVAGAAGVALFVALMTATAAALSAQGVVPVEALAAGIRTGFLCGAILSLFAVLASFFVQRPPMPAGFGH